MIWRVLSAAVLLASTADAARIAIRCYDGASSATVRWGQRAAGTRLGICDRDQVQNGECRFSVSLSATSTSVARVFDVTLKTGRRSTIRYAGTTATLRCRKGPEPVAKPADVSVPPDAITLTCHDAILANPQADPACDVDQVCDDTCDFGFRCPIACGSLAACFSEPAYRLPVPVGEHRVLAACQRGGRAVALDLKCQPSPADFVCPTTTTTLPPPGRCQTDADCADEPPECHHCELGACQGYPTINPNGSISGIICPLPH